MLKVAAGVFLGIMHVLAVIKLPDWLKDRHNHHAQVVIHRLTPEELMARCGKPVSEKRSKDERRMTYQGRASMVVAVFYSLSKTEWNLNHAELGALSVGVWEKNGAGMILAELPCLDKKD